MDLVFVLDSSGSITRPRFDMVKQTVIAIVNELDVGWNGTRIGLVYWSNTAHVAFTMNDYGQVHDYIRCCNRFEVGI